MAFPQDPLGLKVEFDLNGWTEVTSNVYARDQIRIGRGRSDEAQQVDTTRCQLTLDNRSGDYSPRNPEGAHYGLIGRNTPIRVSVLEGDCYLDLGTDGYGTTADHASLDITGDIDVRVDATVTPWTNAGDAVELAGKWGAAGQRSWLFAVEETGLLTLVWSANGTATLSSSSTVPVVVPGSGRLAVRATLDVNNGASGHAVTFYTAPSLSGTWTQLGPAVTTAGTTSIFSSTAAVQVGNVTSASEATPEGKAHAFQLRDGIAGTVVANPDWTVQSSGTTSFADSAGRTWTLGSPATITNRRVRFSGEVASWSPRWDTGGNDVYTLVEASGIARRLGQGATPLKSA
ncbi:MAG TPA: hypothetical protein VHU40_06305, partial [Polyangia bacterium]|nr:hypothetical protein [Polyangia bacterium]